ncbi:secreted antigen 1 [Babesia divergens]|uniref:Secreted antigen 1 n=1 Tax=Babesia divergens TaxID=32595 RepID=A0AAD9G6L0_BABDI|nr:secreted antigen 1 [Babesia divergens]
MRFWGILRVSGLCLLAIGFHGQPVSCGIFKGPKKPKKDSNAKVSENLKDSTVKSKAVEKPKDSNVESPLVEVAEDSTVKSQDAVPEDRKEPHDHSDFSNDFNSEYEKKEPIKEAEKSSEEHEQHDVARKTETDVTNGPSTINLSDGSKNPDGSIATPSSNGTAKDMEAEQEERLKEISEDLKDSNVESSSQEPSSKSSAPAPKSNLVFQRPSWDVSQLANTIVFIKEFCEEVKGYKFSGNIPAGNIRKLSEACSWVSFYLKSFRWRRVRGLDENPYEDALKPEKFKDYAEWLKKHLPVIRTSMINMHNETLNLTEKQRETATSSGPYKYGFVHNDNWWKAVGSQFVLDSFGMAPSLLESLKDLKSSLDDILKSPEDSPVESSSKSSAPVTNSNLVFKNSKWDDSMLASTFLFLEEFCKDVKAEKFNEHIPDKKFKDLSKKCRNVSSYVGSFIHRFKPTYGPGSVAERKEIDMDFYKDVLKSEDFDVYAKWLVENIPGIKGSLELMSMEYLRASEKQRETDTKVGPFIYGFVYTGKPWGELSHISAGGFFGSSTILESFKDLRSSLENVLKSFPKDSTVKSQAD